MCRVLADLMNPQGKHCQGSRYRFALPARDFGNQWSKAGPAHHCAIGVGHIAGKIEKLARLLGIECRKIC